MSSPFGFLEDFDLLAYEREYGAPLDEVIADVENVEEHDDPSVSSESDDSEIDDELEAELDIAEGRRQVLERRQVGGVYPAPVDVDSDSAILDRHFSEISARFNGVRVGVFRFVLSPDELEASGAERDPFYGIERVIFTIYNYIFENFPQGDRVQVEILSTDFTMGAVTSALVTVADADPMFILRQLEQMIQSNTEVRVDSGNFHVRVTRVPALRGGSYETQRATILNSFTTLTLEVLRKTRCIHDIPQALHPFCGVAGLILGKELADSDGELVTRAHRNRWRQLNRLTALRRRCYAVCRDVGVVDHDEGLTIAGMRTLAQVRFSLYKVVVFSTRTHLTPLCVFNEHEALGPIYLLLDDTGHYSLITKLNAFLGKTGVYCPTCYRFFSGASTAHTCDTTLCKQCKRVGCGGGDASEVIRCVKCAQGFFGKECFENHKMAGGSPLFKGFKTVCQNIMACEMCNHDLKAVKGVRTDRNAYDRSATGKFHVCFKNKCRQCGEVCVLSTHECYIRPVDPKSSKFARNHARLRGKTWFYDMETMKCFDESRQCEVFVPNLIVLKSETGDRHVFSGAKCLEDFCDFCFVAPDSLAYGTEYHRVFAHNGSRFDAMFVLQGFCDVMSVDPNIICDGASPLQIKFQKVSFLDTCKFFMCPLSALPAQFGLAIEKGDFPHEFNTSENQDYVGPLPAAEMYGTRFMTAKRFNEFSLWHAEEDAKIKSGASPLWDFQAELLKYCERDVDVLCSAWSLFEKEMFTITGIYPGVQNVSAASFTNWVWKTTISRGEIGVIPPNNYVRNDKQSLVAREWLVWRDWFYYAGEMQYAGKTCEGEKRIQLPNVFYKVDGFHPPSDTVFEFAGCFYHGCSRCTKPDSRSPFSNKSFRDTRSEFTNRIAYLKARGYSVEVMWECEWRPLKAGDEEVRDQILEMADHIPEALPLDPRDALFGGRCEVASIICPTPDEKASGRGVTIKGLDFTSLYPYIMKNCDYPLRHPKVHFGPPDSFDYKPNAYFGLVKCVVLPPRGLFFPILPCRVEGVGKAKKLIFPLCLACAKERNRDKCPHGEAERALSGTWFSEELYLAVSRGYRILKISCVWDYGRCHRKGVFTRFVDKFYKLKTEASGYPASCTTPASKEAYVAEFARVEGIKLDPQKIGFNSPRRTGVKLILNSAWGKWSQREETHPEVSPQQRDFPQVCRKRRVGR